VVTAAPSSIDINRHQTGQLAKLAHPTRYCHRKYIHFVYDMTLNTSPINSMYGTLNIVAGLTANSVLARIFTLNFYSPQTNSERHWYR
jgi:hypothetical protein